MSSTTLTRTPACPVRRNPRSALHWLSGPLGLFNRPQVDPAYLPQHLQRDLGFLDGNDPRGRRR